MGFKNKNGAQVGYPYSELTGITQSWGSGETGTLLYNMDSDSIVKWNGLELENIQAVEIGSISGNVQSDLTELYNEIPDLDKKIKKLRDSLFEIRVKEYNKKLNKHITSSILKLSL